MKTTVTGQRRINAKLSKFVKVTNKEIVRPSMAAGLKVAAKTVKAEIRPFYKDVKKSIGWKIRSDKGNLSGKVGAAVGFRRKKKITFLQQQEKRRKGNPGVGFSPQNVHWWFLGTKKRYIKSGANAGRYTGRMPQMNRSITKIVYSNKMEVFGAAVDAAVNGFDKVMR